MAGCVFSGHLSDAFVQRIVVVVAVLCEHSLNHALEVFIGDVVHDFVGFFQQHPDPCHVKFRVFVFVENVPELLVEVLVLGRNRTVLHQIILQSSQGLGQRESVAIHGLTCR